MYVLQSDVQITVSPNSIHHHTLKISVAQVGFPVVKNLLANAGDLRDTGLIPVLGKPLGGRHGNPLQFSCLEIPMDRGAWLATVHEISESWS